MDLALKKTRARAAQLAFEALSIEGGLLSPDWLSRVAQLGAGGQSEADYRIPKGLNLRDEIGRYWRIAQAHWGDFASGCAGKDDVTMVTRRFILALLRESFGFSTLASAETVVFSERVYPIGFAALEGRVPVVIAPAGSGLDMLALAFGDGKRRRSAFGLTQEYLNAADDAMWGFVTDGLTLRIVRDNASLTRPAWLEADLQRIFVEERYADFTTLRLLAHETRFGRAEEAVSACALETWRNAGREEGTRARKHLRGGVEDALVALGQGFLAHPENQALREALQNGALSTKDYFNQLLRLVYRLIFLLTVEERGLLHPEDVAEKATSLYAEGYSMKRLRERSVKRSAHDHFSDIWEATKIVFRGLASGEARLGLPPLAGLFAKTQCPALDAARLENHALLFAVSKLAWLREDTSLARVNWRDMGPEELGSVYESLLELVPQITKDGRQFAFSTGGETKGNARKTTGSYYTHDSLVQMLLDSALEPVIADAIEKNPANPVAAILDLSIVDPACGSGHFLLASARRLAAHIVRLQTNSAPSAAEYRRALRQVVGRCIYGVDLNSMAVDLCKVALWMEAVEPGLPLTFLNSHIQHGNALLGTTTDLMMRGIPDAAWNPLEGDDRKISSVLKKRNKKAAQEQRSLDNLWSRPVAIEAQTVTLAIAELDAESDANVEALAKKEEHWDGILDSSEYRHQKFIADAWCAAFVWPKKPGDLVEAAPTNDVWRDLCDDQSKPLALTCQIVSELSENYRFFHWHLQFPQVFAKGGFNVVLGNPPWDELTPSKKEFFAIYEPKVRFQDARGEKEIVDRLLDNPAISSAWSGWCRELYGQIHFIKNSGRYKLFAPGNLGKGDLNIFRMFVESALRLVRSGGRVSQIVPEALYNGANSMKIREELFDSFTLHCLYGFENSAGVWFPDVHRGIKFALYAGQLLGTTNRFRVAFNIRTMGDLLAARRNDYFELPVQSIREFSPDALALMEFSSQYDISVAARLYSAAPTFGDDKAGPPYREHMAELHMTADRPRFTENPSDLPVYEGRMVDAFDHRAKAYRSGRGRAAVWSELQFGSPDKKISPQWFVHPNNLPSKIGDRTERFRVGFCNITGPTNERTLLASLIPPGTVCGNTVPIFTFPQGYEWAYMLWLAVANSLVMDFLVRRKISLHITNTLLDSLPFPRLDREDLRVAKIVPMVAKLTCVGEEMRSFWDILADEGWLLTVRNSEPLPVFIREEDRTRARDELDAFVALHIFRLDRDELSYVLDSSLVIARRDVHKYGEFRTKRAILESYDAMLKAALAGESHLTNFVPSSSCLRPNPPEIKGPVRLRNEDS